jgi:hypothetical protein
MTGKSTAAEERNQRLAKALRENLKRRKAQQRARSQGERQAVRPEGSESGLPPHSDAD